MFSTIYFAASSVLACAGTPAGLAAKVFDGNFPDAMRDAARLADFDDPAHQPGYAALQLRGDLELALGRHEDAEETYRRAHKAARDSRDMMRVVSCRNTGWQALFRNQFSVALTCFKRVSEDKAATLLQQLDAHVGTTLVLFHLGCVQAAWDRLSGFSALALAAQDKRWSALAAALYRDMRAQHRLHCSEALADHIYWRSVNADAGARHVALEAVSPPSVALPLLGARAHYLERLDALAKGDHVAAEALREYANQIRRMGLHDYYRSLCLEIAMAALATQASGIAEAMLEVSGAAALQGSQHTRWYLDFLYCRAKIMQQQMRTQEFAQLYGRYALASIQHVRADNVLMPVVSSTAQVPSDMPPRSDDVSARLPAKYRRAYRYLMDNLDQKDLSVREVASQVGVTERAMQAAFRLHLGISPSELIRRQRMERIRDELLDDGAPTTRVLDVARKWGVQHRSTLINGYRRTFQEAPSQTLAR